MAATQTKAQQKEMPTTRELTRCAVCPTLAMCVFVCVCVTCSVFVSVLPSVFLCVCVIVFAVDHDFCAMCCCCSENTCARFCFLDVLERLALVALARAASARALRAAAGDVRLDVRSGGASGAEVLDALAAGAAAAQQQGVLARGRDRGELVEGQALAAGADDAVAGLAREAQRADADLGQLRHANVVEDVADDDRDGRLRLGGVLPHGLALEHDGEAAQADRRAVAAALEQALVDRLVERRLRALCQELVQLDEQLDVRVRAVRAAADEVLGLLNTSDIDAHCW